MSEYNQDNIEKLLGTSATMYNYCENGKSIFAALNIMKNVQNSEKEDSKLNF